MLGLAAVRRAGQRELRVDQPEALGRAGGHQRQRLQALDGGARVDGAVDVAALAQHGAGGVDDGERAAMEGLDDVAAPEFDEDGLGHARAPGIGAPIRRSAFELEHLHDGGQLARLFLQALGRRGRFLDERRVLLRHLVELRDRGVDLADAASPARALARGDLAR